MPRKVTFPGIGSCYQLSILCGGSTDSHWFVTLLVPLSVSGGEPKSCLRCWLDMSAAERCSHAQGSLSHEGSASLDFRSGQDWWMKKHSEDDIYDVPERPRRNLGVWQFADIYRQNAKDTASITGPQWRITTCFIKLWCGMSIGNLEKLGEREVVQGALWYVAGGSMVSADMVHLSPEQAKLPVKTRLGQLFRECMWSGPVLRKIVSAVRLAIISLRSWSSGPAPPLRCYLLLMSQEKFPRFLGIRSHCQNHGSLHISDY